MMYLLIAVVGAFSIGYLHAELMVENDPLSTYDQVVRNQSLLRLGVLGDVVVIVLEFILSVLLYRIFSRYNQGKLLVATGARLAMAVIMGINLITLFIPLSIEGFKGIIDEGSMPMVVYTSLKIHHQVEMVWQLFFGLHLVLLTYVLNQSKMLSKVLVVVLFLGGMGYLLDSLLQLMSFEIDFLAWPIGGLLACAAIGEVWLAIKLTVQHRNLHTSKV